MNTLTITIEIEHDGDTDNPNIDDVIDIVATQVKDGCREGSNSNESQNYWYEVEHH